MATLIKQTLSSAWSGVRLIHLNEQCAALLTELEKIPGFHAAFVCDNHGQVLGALSTHDFDRGLYDTIGQNIAQTFAAFQARSGCKDLEYRFEQKIVFARDLRNAFVVILLTVGASLSMLRMAVNVAAESFETDIELQTNLKQAAAARTGSLAQDLMNASTWQLAHQANLVKRGA